MKILEKSFVSRARMFQSALFAFLLAGVVLQSGAQIYTISDPNNNSSVQVSLSGGSSGLSDWQVGGMNQLYQQWFYYSLGSGTINSIDTIASPSSINNHNTGPAPFLSATYAGSAISVTTKFGLNNTPTLSDTITVLNPLSSGQTQVFHFYQYSDFDLGGVAGSQNVQFNSNGSGTAYEVDQAGGTASLEGTVTAVSGGVSVVPEEQAGIYDGAQFGLANGNAAPTLNDTLIAGPGDVVYAYEWDLTLAPGSSIQISENQIITVPEPSTLVLISVGIGILGWGLSNRRCRGTQASFLA